MKAMLKPFRAPLYVYEQFCKEGAISPQEWQHTLDNYCDVEIFDDRCDTSHSVRNGGIAIVSSKKTVDSKKIITIFGTPKYGDVYFVGFSTMSGKYRVKTIYDRNIYLCDLTAEQIKFLRDWEWSIESLRPPKG